MAHVIGHGNTGPRSDHELANYIDRNGFDNLLMLCLECHKTVDELEAKYPVTTLKLWKSQHKTRVDTLFTTPRTSDEREILQLIHDLLNENLAIFLSYGPFSENVLAGQSGDAIKIWRKRCLDTILPNNEKIIKVVENNRRSFPYPWELYGEMLNYKMHSDAFRDNCLTDTKVNDYKLFPQEFPRYVREKLGLSSSEHESHQDEDLEYRSRQIETFISRFFQDHKQISGIEQLNKATMIVETVDGRNIKVFVTNTYFFTEYTLDRVLAYDPAIDAIICSCPAGGYSDSAKRTCIEQGIGLFMLGEFMGALWKHKTDFLNFLLRAEREDRVEHLKRTLSRCKIPGTTIYAFGSYLRGKTYTDIDLLVAYEPHVSLHQVNQVETCIKTGLAASKSAIDLTICSSAELREIREKLAADNLTLL